MTDVRSWLIEHGFQQHVDLFEENEIDGEVLFDLTNDDLKELGLPLGQRKKLLKAIEYASQTTNQPEEKHSSAMSPHGERRQVTVLFADLAGYTALSASLDPEETHRLLNAYFSAVDCVIEEHGGTVDKHIGDAVMAVFGAPIAHSDDPLRALRAASGIHDAMLDLEQQFSRELRAHIGIASGVVVASRTGSERHTEYTVTGDTVNLASRLDDLASPGETLVSDAVHSALGPFAEFSARGSTSIKGLDGSVQVWAFERLLTEDDATWLTKFIGRTAELRQFKSIVRDTLTDRSGQTLLLRGEPGIGKTRLTSEFASLAIHSGLSVHRISMVDFGTNRGARTLLDLVASLLDLPSNPSLEQRSEARTRALKEGHVAIENQVFLNDLLDLDQPDELRSAYEALGGAARKLGMRTTLSTLVAQLAQEAPRMIIAEDVHWADPSTLDTLAGAALKVPDCPAIFVLTSRIEGRTLNQEWLSSLRSCPLTTIDLQPLRQDDAMKLASSLSGSDAASLENLVKRADGNPLFLEQLISGLSIHKGDQLPDTIQGLVLARADNLPRADREALFAASALGQRFRLDLLQELIDDPSYSGDNLVQLRLLQTEGEEHVFCHALVRDGLYASMVGEQRQGLHLRAASLYDGRNPIMHAQHLDLAGSDEAATAYLAAAHRESERIHYEAALQLVLRGIELASSQTTYALNFFLGDLQRRLGNIDEAIDAFGVALNSTSDRTEKCQALIGVAEGLRITESYPELLDTLESALQEIENLDAPKERARICQLKGSVHFVHGETTQCLNENHLSLEFARTAGSRELEAQALGNLADAEFSRGRMISAHKLFDDCVNLAAEHDLYNVAAANLSMRGQTLLYLGQPTDALGDCESALDLAVGQFNPRAELVARLVGVYALELYDTRACYQWAKAGVTLARRIGAQRFELVCVEYLGRLAAIDGDAIKAEQLVSEALSAFRSSKSSMRFLGGRALGSFALVCQDSEQRKAALFEGEELLELGVGAHNPLWFYRDAIEVSLELGDWHEVERFAQNLEEYTSAEPLKWSHYFSARGRALANAARGDDALEQLMSVRAEGERIGFIHSLARIDAAAS